MNVPVVRTTFSAIPFPRASLERMRTLEALKSYFEYRGYVCCGIPTITLEGAPRDWKDLHLRARELSRYGLETRIAGIEPILSEFERTSQGRPSKSFWSSFVKVTTLDAECTTVHLADGWITRLFPYDGDSPREDLSGALDLDHTPSSTSAFPFHLTDNGQERAFQVISGFSGISQDKFSGALAPEIGWSVFETPSENGE